MVYLLVAAGKLFPEVGNLIREMFNEAGILSVITGIVLDRLPVTPDILILNLDKPSPFDLFSFELARLNPAADCPLVDTELFRGVLG